MPSQNQSKALVLHKIASPLHLELQDFAVPSPPSHGSANVRILASPISATTSKFLTGASTFLTFPTPFVPGHSAIGRVQSTGPDATLLKEGDLVYVDSFIRSRDDPVTTQILLGLNGGPHAEQRHLMESGWPRGLFQTVATTPLENTHRLDAETLLNRFGYTVSELAISIPRLSIVYGGMRAVDLKAGQTLLVGPATGFFSGAAVELGVALGARVIAISRSAPGLERLKTTLSRTYPDRPALETVVVTGDVSADEAAVRALLPTGSPGIDAFIDLSPGLGTQPSHVQVGFGALRPGGKVALMGGIYGNLNINHAQLLYKSVTIKGQWMHTKEEVEELLRMVEAGIVKIGKTAGYEVRGEYPLEQWSEAIELAAAGDEWAKGYVFTPLKE
ncbi:hypothetical protein jhhlp_005455 [Lomentospora prolificans]|uniref:Alcohol dehydrogenase-like C-terminal domain-containing protein n=1 Tax=Lomentospora prolificans TaxID=41688 RepID=A0A2N3N6W6_9PEZI|nr:hypothetical protein jhhlp_005455 [Lomentospora prolificans]